MSTPLPRGFYDHVARTPVLRLPRAAMPASLRSVTAEVWLKDETRQRTGAFKFRGNVARLMGAAPGTRLVTASTGNHGLGLATAAQRLGLTAEVWVSESTPDVKRNALQTVGADLRVRGGDYDVAQRWARRAARQSGALYVHSFDDPAVVQGHRSLYDELLEAVPGVERLYVPVGGGGLFTACLASCTARSIDVVGVELDGAPALARAVSAGRRVALRHITGWAEGVMVHRIGRLAFAAMGQHDRVTLRQVSGAEVARAMRLLWKACGIRAEGAGALALAAALQDARQRNAMGRRRLRVGCIVSGGNVDDGLFDAVMAGSEPETPSVARNGGLGRTAPSAVLSPPPSSHPLPSVETERHAHRKKN